MLIYSDNIHAVVTAQISTAVEKCRSCKLEKKREKAEFG